MAAKFTFDLVTPEEQLFSTEVEMAVVPAAEGELGVMAGHAPVIATLKPGAIRLYDHGDVVSSILFVTGGFVEITQERCTVLAEEAFPLSEVSRLDAERRLDEAKTQQTSAKGDFAVQLATKKVEAAEALLYALAS